MKKIAKWLLPSLMIVLAALSCQKEPSATTGSVESLLSGNTNKENSNPRPLKGGGLASYNFVPNISAGWVNPNPAPGWYAGKGEGQLTHMGNAWGIANMYVTLGPTGLQGTPAPVNMFFASELSELGITIPDAVSIISFDKHGNSIWGKGIGTVAINLVSPTRVTFGGPAEIIGGTGRFERATGQYVFSGYFNPQNHDAGFDIDGMILY